MGPTPKKCCLYSVKQLYPGPMHDFAKQMEMIGLGQILIFMMNTLNNIAYGAKFVFGGKSNLIKNRYKTKRSGSHGIVQREFLSSLLLCVSSLRGLKTHLRMPQERLTALTFLMNIPDSFFFNLFLLFLNSCFCICIL